MMRVALGDTRQNSATTANQMWQAVGNINWLARSFDWYQKTAQESLKASEQQSLSAIKATQDQMRLDQRAWVSIIAQRLSSEPVANEDLSITYVLHNSGRTPALNMSLREGMFIGSFGGPNGEPRIPNWQAVPTKKGAILFPEL